MTFEQFKDYYMKKGICLGQMSKPKHTLNDKELKTRYEKYIKLKKEKVDRKSTRLNSSH